MNRSIVARLVAKDVYLLRWLILGALLSGSVALVIASTSRIGFGIGGIAYITTLVALGIFIGMFSVVGERKENALLFVMSLPVSTLQYAKAKVLSASITFLVPWVILTLAAVVVMALGPTPNGRIPSSIALLVFFLGNFYIFLAVTMTTTGDGWPIAAILVTNMSISLFVSALRLIPSIEEHVEGPVAVWSTPILVVIGIEVAIVAGALGLIFYVLSRKKDFV